MTEAGEEIKRYWEGRAAADAASPQVTTNDVYLRTLELATLVETIKALDPSPATMLDVGCGDGRTTVEVSQAISGLVTLGVDYSANMIALARSRLEELPDLSPRVTFSVG